MIWTLIHDKIRAEIVQLYLTVLEALQTILKLFFIDVYKFLRLVKNEFRFKL